MKPAGKIFVNHGIQCVDLKARIAYQLKCILPIIKYGRQWQTRFDNGSKPVEIIL